MLADVELASAAEVIAVDRISGKPLLVCNHIGKGSIYLLCTWAYPGHEMLRDFMPHLLDLLMERHVKRDIFVEDPSGDVYWSVWETAPGKGKLYLLNTDWSEAENKKAVTVRVGDCVFPFQVREGFVEEIVFSDGVAFHADDHGCLSHLNGQANGKMQLSGIGNVTLRVWTSRDISMQLNDIAYSLSGGEAFSKVLDLSACGNRMTIRKKFS